MMPEKLLTPPGPSSATVSIIRRNIREGKEGKYDIDRVVQRLLTKIRTITVQKDD